MGQAADRKVIEIDETRQRLERDLLEIEERLPAPLRSVKSLLGIVVGGALTALVAKKIFSRDSDKRPAAELVVRVIREDRTTEKRR